MKAARSGGVCKAPRKLALTTSEQGVLKLMQQPHVFDAVLCVLRAAENNGESAQEELTPAAAEPEREAPGPPPPKPPPGPAKLPSIEVMQEAGYQGSAGSMRNVWAWAKDFGADHVVWPTPTSGMQEALRFDAHGWPHSQSTAAQWLEMINFWLLLREQMSCGASRAQRGAVDKLGWL